MDVVVVGDAHNDIFLVLVVWKSGGGRGFVFFAFCCGVGEQSRERTRVQIRWKEESRVASAKIGVLKLRVRGLMHGQKSEGVIHTEVAPVVCVVV